MEYLYCMNNMLQLLLQILLTMIWLRRYPTMQTLSMLFGVHVSSVHKIIHRFIKVLHAYLVPKYICWHSMNTWRRLSGTFADWPRVVAILDGTPFRISRPKGQHIRTIFIFRICVLLDIFNWRRLWIFVKCHHHPQLSCIKVMFPQASVILCMGRGCLHGSRDGHCSGCYISCWNAFLLLV